MEAGQHHDDGKRSQKPRRQKANKSAIMTNLTGISNAGCILFSVMSLAPVVLINLGINSLTRMDHVHKYYYGKVSMHD